MSFGQRVLLLACTKQIETHIPTAPRKCGPRPLYFQCLLPTWRLSKAVPFFWDANKTTSLGTAASNGPIIRPLADIWINMEHWRNESWKRNRSTQTTVPVTLFPPKKTTWTKINYSDCFSYFLAPFYILSLHYSSYARWRFKKIIPNILKVFILEICGKKC